MTEDQLETWAYKMIRACNRSTSDSDINAIKLDHYIKNLYEQGRADEREACAALCVEFERSNLYGVKECANAIRARGKK
jgi:hypothetical protein